MRKTSPFSGSADDRRELFIYDLPVDGEKFFGENVFHVQSGPDDSLTDFGEAHPRLPCFEFSHLWFTCWRLTVVWFFNLKKVLQKAMKTNTLHVGTSITILSLRAP